MSIFSQQRSEQLEFQERERAAVATFTRHSAAIQQMLRHLGWTMTDEALFDNFEVDDSHCLIQQGITALLESILFGHLHEGVIPIERARLRQVAYGIMELHATGRLAPDVIAPSGEDIRAKQVRAACEVIAGLSADDYQRLVDGLPAPEYLLELRGVNVDFVAQAKYALGYPGHAASLARAVRQGDHEWIAELAVRPGTGVVVPRSDS